MRQFEETGYRRAKSKPPRPQWAIDFTLPIDPERNTITRIYGDAQSVCFDTTDQEGNERAPSFELTWAEIFTACRQAIR